MDSAVTDSPEQLQQFPCEKFFVVVVMMKLLLLALLELIKLLVKKTGAPKPPKGNCLGTPEVSHPFHKVRGCLVTGFTDSPGQLHQFPSEVVAIFAVAAKKFPCRKSGFYDSV